MLFFFSSQLIFSLPLKIEALIQLTLEFFSTLTTFSRKTMGLLGLLFVGLVLSLGSTVYASNDGWIDAHATFYGGGDASGTMG
jgi:hypothetical protein